LVLIERFRLRDYDSVKSLWKSAGLDFSPGDELPQLKRKLKRDPELFLVAREGSSLIGTVLGGWDGRRGWVYHLAVAKSARRQRVATKLLQELESRMKSKGVLKVNALVYDWNVASLALFELNGFKRQDGQVIVGKYLTKKT
jgi:ribosomal protein S18 acetylase RimI-like enzyme